MYVFCEFYGDGLPSIWCHLFASCHLLNQYQSPECMNVKAHNNIMPTVDCRGFHNSDTEYQRELAGICHKPRLKYTCTLSYSLSTVAVKYGIWYVHYTAYLLSASHCHLF